MASVPNPVDLWALYDFVMLCSQQSPGIAKLSGFERAQKWDVKDGDGQDGATTTLKGDVIAKGTITLQLWADESGYDAFADYDEWRKIFVANIGNKSKGLDIYHPDLARLDIKAVCIESESQLKHDGKGGATVDIKVLEFKPPKPKPAQTPDGSKKKKKDGPDPDQALIDDTNRARNQGKRAKDERGGESVFFDDGTEKAALNKGGGLGGKVGKGGG